MNFEAAELELRVARCAREGDNVANVFQAGQVHHHAFEAETESGVGHRAVTAQVEVPPVGFFVQTASAQPFGQDIVALFALAAADDLADPRHEHVHGAHGFAVVVDAHVKGFDRLSGSR